MKKTIFFFFFLFSLLNINAQDSTKDRIPQEEIYAHVNNTLLFTGEYLYYKVYSLKADDLKPSEISKVAYVDIIDNNGKTVHNQIINLENGTGFGDYFIPTEVGSGNYKLIAYTNWSRNNDRNRFFEQDIFVINPYTSAQSEVRKDSIQYEKTGLEIRENSEIILNKNRFLNRELVTVEIPSLGKGNFSVSVRKLDSLPHPDLVNSHDFLRSGGNQLKEEVEKTAIPELRGKLINGKISSAVGKNIQNVKLSLSIPGEDYFLRLGNTNSKGEFHFNVDETFVSEKAMLQVIDPENADFKIRLDQNQQPNLKQLEFKDFGVDPNSEELILDRSVQNQIENAYFNLKPDTLRTGESDNIFDGVARESFVLDEYRRFETLKETFIEIIPYARIRKQNGNYRFSVLGYPPYEIFSGQPLVVIDGLPLKDVNEFVETYESRRIKKIDIIRDKYYLGSAFFNGVIIIETINGDFTQNYNKDFIRQFELTSGNLRKDYFKQEYHSDSDERIPDFRTQLLWDPEIGGNRKLEFYTSDVDGIFEISIQGFTSNGKPVSLKGLIEVE